MVGERDTYLYVPSRWRADALLDVDETDYCMRASGVVLKNYSNAPSYYAEHCSADDLRLFLDSCTDSPGARHHHHHIREIATYDLWTPIRLSKCSIERLDQASRIDLGTDHRPAEGGEG